VEMKGRINAFLRGSLFHDSMTPENMTPTKLKDDSRWLVLGLVGVRVSV